MTINKYDVHVIGGGVYPGPRTNSDDEETVTMWIDAEVRIEGGWVTERGLLVVDGPYVTDPNDVVLDTDLFVDALVYTPSANASNHATHERVDGIRCIGCSITKDNKGATLISCKAGFRLTIQDAAHPPRRQPIERKQAQPKDQSER